MVVECLACIRICVTGFLHTHEPIRRHWWAVDTWKTGFHQGGIFEWLRNQMDSIEMGRPPLNGWDIEESAFIHNNEIRTQGSCWMWSMAVRRRDVDFEEPVFSSWHSAGSSSQIWQNWQHIVYALYIYNCPHACIFKQSYVFPAAQRQCP